VKGSLLAPVLRQLPEERFDTLAAGGGVTIERIVSRGHASPDGFWYDQDRDEFVLVVQGRAGLRIAGEAEPVVLGPGDYVMVRAHVRHRVEWTDPEVDTIWLAVHFPDDPCSDPSCGGEDRTAEPA
jgi:cupin 2 domain-containing protein